MIKPVTFNESVNFDDWKGFKGYKNRYYIEPEITGENPTEITKKVKKQARIQR